MPGQSKFLTLTLLGLTLAWSLAWVASPLMAQTEPTPPTEDSQQPAEEPPISTSQPANPESQPNSESDPKLVIEKTDHDFGATWIGEPLNHTFEIKNDGPGSLKILNVQPSCGCTVAQDYNREIAAGQTGKIPITLNTSKLNGPFTKTINVTTNDKQKGRLTLKITGTVKRYVTVDPVRVDFGTLQPQEEKSTTVKLTNNAETPMELILEKNDFGAFLAELTEKIAGKEYELTIKSKPPYQDGRNQAIVTLKTNIAQEPQLRIVTAATIPPKLEISPQQLILSATNPTETTQTITVVNNSNAPINLLEVTSDDERLTVKHETQEPGKKYSVSVQIPAEYQVSQDSPKTLTLKFDDPEKPLVTVPIRTIVRPQKPALALQGKSAPAVEITTHSGTTFNSSKIEDPAVVLVFYATWCGYCKRTLPELQKIYESYKDKGVRFIAVNQDNPQDGMEARRISPEQGLEKLKELGITFEVAFDPEKKFGTLFKAMSFPTLFILDKTGTIVKAHVGGATDPGSLNAFKQVLDKTLASSNELAKPADDSKAASQSDAPTPAPGSGSH